MPNNQHTEMWLPRSREPLNRTFEQWGPTLLRRAIFAASLSLLTTASAQTTKPSAPQESCSQSVIDRLEAESDNIRDWSSLRSFYHRYRKCGVDDAEVTEGVSESVARMFADNWKTLPTAQALFRRDPVFERFALAGLNITDLSEDLNHIDALAAKQCPSGLNELCYKIRKAIRDNK